MILNEEITEIEVNDSYAKQTIRKSNLVYRTAKRVFDICASLIALILLSPVLLIISALVYLGDPGPMIYGQIRIGKNGKPFKMWKFRSMYKNSDRMIDQLTPE